MAHNCGSLIRQVLVADLMARDVVSVGPEATLLEVVRLMVAKSIRHVPVLDGDRLVGIISDRDVRIMATRRIDPADRQRLLELTKVADIGLKPVVTIEPQASAPEAAKLFWERRIGCLPVVDDDGAMLGVLTQTDLIKWLAQVEEE